MKKRLLSIVLSLCMVLALMPQMAFADTISDTTEDGFSYTISDAGEATITRYNGSVADVEIPSLIQYGNNGYPVTAIGNDCFSYRSIKSVKIPDSVTSIGGSAFSSCTSLTNVTFEENSQLTSIGAFAFSECTSLTSITIPSNVTSIGYDAFSECTSLTSIMVDENNTVYSSVDGVLFNNSGKELIKYPADKTSTSYSIPDGVTSIGGDAFYGCTNLERITIPDGVTSIGRDAFSHCTSLKSITIPDGVTSIAYKAFYGCTNLERITIPNSVTSIGESAFNSCSSLESITIPYGVTSIGKYMFYDCTSLTSITIPNSVTKIEWGAFQYCSGLTDVYYLGTKEQWNQIIIVNNNSDLTGDNNAKVRYVGNITKDFSFTPPSNLTYDGEAKEATVTKTNEDYGDVTIKYYDQNDQVYTTGPVDAGTYTVKIDIAASDKYDAISGYEIGRFTILQAENSFTKNLSIEDWSYGDTPNAPNAAAKFGELTYSYSTDEDGTYTADQPTNAGTYWVKATVDETKNYTGLVDKIQFTISSEISTVDPEGTTGGASDDNADKNAKTGDDTNLALWLALMILAGAGITGTAVYTRRKRTNE